MITLKSVSQEMEVVRPQITPHPEDQSSSICPILYSFLKIKPILLLWTQIIRSVIHTAVGISMYRLRKKIKKKRVCGEVAVGSSESKLMMLSQYVSQYGCCLFLLGKLWLVSEGRKSDIKAGFLVCKRCISVFGDTNNTSQKISNPEVQMGNEMTSVPSFHTLFCI